MTMRELSERKTTRECECGAIFEDATATCKYCGGNTIRVVEELICIPVESGKHFRFDTALAMLLNQFAGKRCKVRIEECSK